VHALHCDLRFAADNTAFATAFSRGLRYAKPEGRSVVEPGGIEPPTSSLRTTRSPS
jgi:hypothetical protein